MTHKVGTAVIGLGTIGAVHAETYSQIPESQFVAVCSRRQEIVEAYERKYGVKGYTDYRELLDNSEVEAVTICTPHNLHHEMALAAAKSGKHVAVEKPLGISLKEADDMVEAVRNAGVHDLYMENLCFAPSHHLAKEAVDSGTVGQVYLCKARESVDFIFDSEAEKSLIEGKSQWSWYFDPAKTGGGQLISTGCHPIQYVRYIYNRAPIKRVYAEISEHVGNKKKPGIEDAALLTMRFEGGGVGEIETSFYANGGTDDKAEIYGNKGSIFIDLYNRNPVTIFSHVGYNFGQSIFVPPNANRGWTYPMPDENYSLGYHHEQRHFLKSILQDKRPIINFDDGRATLEVIEAGYRSHQTGAAISLPLT